MVTRRHARSGSPFETSIGFSRALRSGPLVSVAGSGPMADDGTSYAVGDPEGQARRCLEIGLRALAELGARPEEVIRTRMFIVDPADADAIGRAHAEVFRDVMPAATMVVVAALLRPEWKVEIEIDAWSPE
ncbi:MAG: RidA family protein [Myxococcota bacterium]